MTVIERQLPEPYSHVVVRVNPSVVMQGSGQKPGPLTVGVMDERTGKGTRSSADYAEAEARTVLEALAQYRSPEGLDEDGLTPQEVELAKVLAPFLWKENYQPGVGDLGFWLEDPRTFAKAVAPMIAALEKP